MSREDTFIKMILIKIVIFCFFEHFDLFNKTHHFKPVCTGKFYHDKQTEEDKVANDCNLNPSATVVKAIINTI